jgi:Glycosyl hydrolase catalytic core
VRCRGVAAIALVAALAAVAAQSSPASRFLRVGIYDQAQTMYGNTAQTFATFKTLNVQELRLSLYWGGPTGVATRRPTQPANPADPAYDWSAYDAVVRQAASNGIHVVFSIVDTPAWANGGRATNVAPSSSIQLRDFAFAAARRYSGSYLDASGEKLPAVKDWIAWNEPNNPVFLRPQYINKRGAWVIQSAVSYAVICNAIYGGVHATLISGERVACGATAPRGNNSPLSSRPSVSPLVFLHAVKAAGLVTFDAWAHHPYYSGPADAPASRTDLGAGVDEAVTLGNIGDLISTVTQLYGKKRIWITEYGYQTNPPDTLFGVSWAKQAKYLTQAVEIARKNPRIDMFLWFLLKDEPNLSGWQSGLETVSGEQKPAFAAFAQAAAVDGG